jgi:hypothetical protein
MAFRLRHSLHLYLRHVQVTVSRPRGVHCVLTDMTEYNDLPPLRSRLRHDRRVLVSSRPRRIHWHIVMPRVAESNPAYHVSPPPRPAWTGKYDRQASKPRTRPLHPAGCVFCNCHTIAICLILYKSRHNSGNSSKPKESVLGEFDNVTVTIHIFLR